MTANANNVTLRIPLGRMITLEEGDATSQEIKNIIEDFQTFIAGSWADQVTLNGTTGNRLDSLEVSRDSLDLTDNLLADSGRFTFASSTSVGSFESRYLQPYNGATLEEGDKFISDNSTYGGAGAALSQNIIDLLNASGAGPARYGVEFYTAKFTAGSGTSYDVSGSGDYLLTNHSGILTGSSRYIGFWIRCISGHAYCGALTRNIVPADGWVFVWEQKWPTAGYDNDGPRIGAVPGSVVHIAMPVVSAGNIPRKPNATPIMYIGNAWTADTFRATDVQAQSFADTSTVITPSNLPGISATNVDVATGTSNQRFITPAGLQSRIQVQPFDTTPGRLLTTGAFGLGTRFGDIDNLDCNTLDPNVKFIGVTNGNSINGPSWLPFYYIEQFSYVNGNRTQIAIPYKTSATDESAIGFRGYFEGSGWTPWQKVWDSGNLDPVGTADSSAIVFAIALG